MTNLLEYTPKEAYIIEVSEADDKYLFLFFTHIKEGHSKWRLTSKVQRIRVTQDKVLFTTLNSIYCLSTTTLSYENLFMEEFCYCRSGYTPNEARMLYALTNSQQHTSH